MCTDRDVFLPRFVVVVVFVFFVCVVCCCCCCCCLLAGVKILLLLLFTCLLDFPTNQHVLLIVGCTLCKISRLIAFSAGFEEYSRSRKDRGKETRYLIKSMYG